MDFNLNDEQKMLIDTLRKMGERENFKELAKQVDETGEFPLHLIPKYADMGLLGMVLSPDYGGGGQVELQEIADVRVRPVPNVIAREQMKRKLDVGCNVRGRDLGSVAEDVEKAVATVEFPEGVHAELIGEYAERQAAEGRMRGFTILAALGIFIGRRSHV